MNTRDRNRMLALLRENDILKQRVSTGIDKELLLLNQVIDLKAELEEMAASYQRVLAQREALYRQLNAEPGVTQHCPSCKRSLPLDSFDKAERPTRQGVVYTCRACLRARDEACRGAA